MLLEEERKGERSKSEGISYGLGVSTGSDGIGSEKSTDTAAMVVRITS